jgi:8-oxo-dGTP diphosphatase
MIDKVGSLTIRDGRVLLCRKARGTHLLILPGGKREAGETSLTCLDRELEEELGVHAVLPELLGTYTSAAADAGLFVRIELYRTELSAEPKAQSEIAELVWFGAGDDEALLSPSLSHVIFPDLRARCILEF